MLRLRLRLRCRSTDDVVERGGELGGGELERASRPLEVSVSVRDAVRVREFFRHERSSGEATRVVVGVGAGQFAGVHVARVGAHVEDEREQRVAGGELINERPGIYVLACILRTQDGREQTQLGMERTIRIVR